MNVLEIRFRCRPHSHIFTITNKVNATGIKEKTERPRRDHNSVNTMIFFVDDFDICYFGETGYSHYFTAVNSVYGYYYLLESAASATFIVNIQN